MVQLREANPYCIGLEVKGLVERALSLLYEG